MVKSSTIRLDISRRFGLRVSRKSTSKVGIFGKSNPYKPNGIRVLELALGEFGATLMLAGNIPGETATMPMAIYFAVEAGNIEEAWFWALVIMSVSLVGIFMIDHQ